MLEQLLVLAQETEAGNEGGGGFPPQIAMILLLFVIMYFIMIRPEQKRRKAQQRKIAALKPGDAIVTLGGLHGKVSQLKDTTAIIKIADNVKVEIDKIAVSTVHSKEDQKAAAKAGSATDTADPKESATSTEEVQDAEVIEEKTRN